MHDEFSVDVLIVGAGISGIGAAVRLRRDCPETTFAIVEQRPRAGGTWDLFRYPGVRSDSDMHTLGFDFKPWTDTKAIADGASIREYLLDTIREHDLERHIRFEHRVTSAAFSSRTGRWTVELQCGDERTLVVDCQFLFMCAGYYLYDHGHMPEWDGLQDFAGTLIHPQQWPEDIELRDKRIVVIGSGATAMTLVPALVDAGAASVTMLQRSPTYVAALPSEDGIANLLRRWLPETVAYRITRAKNVALGSLFYRAAQRWPDRIKRILLRDARRRLGPGFDVDTHLTPTYNPWDQRLCVVPDGDLFDVLRSGAATIVTSTIDRFTRDGVLLADGRTLDADIVVTATGLVVQMLGGTEIVIDGEARDVGDSFVYKGVMLSGIPNLGMWFGYVNASWTLKADLTSAWFCRLIDHMRSTGTSIAVPVPPPHLRPHDFDALSSGYIARARHLLPKNGSEPPWSMHERYSEDRRLLLEAPIVDRHLELAPRRVPMIVSESVR
jgi:monooxygenase